ESSSDSGSDQSETDEQYYARMSELLRNSVACNIEREGYSETAAKSIKSTSFYKIVYAADDNALRVAPDITDARTTRTSDGFNTVVTPDVTIYHEACADTNSQEFLLIPAAEGGYYIISKSSSKMLSEVGGYPMLRDAAFVEGRRWDIKQAESGRWVITSLSGGAVLNMYHGQLTLEKEELMDDDAWFIYEVDGASWQSVFVDNFEPGYISAMWTRKGNDLTTDGSWVFDGGRIEIKAKLKEGAKAYMTALTATGEEARVDIFDADLAGGTLRCGVSFMDGRKTVKHGQMGVGAGLSDWHEYAVEWDSEQVRFYFDGVMYSVFNVTTDAARASFNGTLMTLSIEGFAPPYSENIDCVKFRKRRGETLSAAGGGTPLEPFFTASAAGECHCVTAINGGFAVAVENGVEFYSEKGVKYKMSVAGLDGAVTSLITSRDGKTLLVLCRGSNNAYVVDCASGAVLTLSGHTDSVTCGALAESGVCVTGARDGTIRVWSAGSGELRGVINAESTPRSAAILSVGERFAVGFNDGYVRVYNTTSRKMYTYFNAHESAVTAVVFCGNDKLATGDASGKLMLWDLGVNIRYYTSAHCLSAINDLAVYYGGLVSAGGDGALRLYTTEKPAEITAIRALHGASVCAVDFVGGVLSVGYDGKAFYCDSGLNVKYELKGLSGFAAGCALSSDGKTAIVCSESGQLCLYNL
ncbi:MAG: family 16 glycosylhydrolase, partial [Clostridia bacterium]|nr:family 16 glycosylhydrolase [Clostridia bacterium]